jgi:YjbE family integral membrane protein
VIWTHSDTAHLFTIVGTNLVLSGDNAMAVGLAVRNLPPGRQRLASAVGVGFAILLQIAATLTLASLIRFPPVALVAGILLAAIAIRLLRNAPGAPGPENGQLQTLSRSVLTVIGAYLLTSVDNILALAALGSDYPAILCAGLLLSSILFVFGGLVVAGLMTRYPLIVTIVAGLLGWRGGAMIAAVLPHLGVSLTPHIFAIVLPASIMIVVMSSPFWMRSAARYDTGQSRQRSQF